MANDNVVRTLLFSSAMVRAVQRKQKFETRRVAREQRDALVCPYGPLGATIRLLSTWATAPEFDMIKPSALAPDVPLWSLWDVDEWLDEGGRDLTPSVPDWIGKRRPGRFLPNTLRPRMPLARLTSATREPLQSIEHVDALDEGMGMLCNEARERWEHVAPPGESVWPTPLSMFRNVWDQLNGIRGFTWESNPDVWVIRFEVLSGVNFL